MEASMLVSLKVVDITAEKKGLTMNDIPEFKDAFVSCIDVGPKDETTGLIPVGIGLQLPHLNDKDNVIHAKLTADVSEFWLDAVDSDDEYWRNEALMNLYWAFIAETEFQVKKHSTWTAQRDSIFAGRQ